MTATEVAEAIEAELGEKETRLAKAKQELEELNRDRSDDDYNLLTETVRKVQELEVRVSQLEEARDRLASPTWGHCQKCGGLIDQERLQVVPDTELCVKCKREKEENRRRGIVFPLKAPIRRHA